MIKVACPCENFSCCCLHIHSKHFPAILASSVLSSSLNPDASTSTAKFCVVTICCCSIIIPLRTVLHPPRSTLAICAQNSASASALCDLLPEASSFAGASHPSTLA